MDKINKAMAVKYSGALSSMEDFVRELSKRSEADCDSEGDGEDREELKRIIVKARELIKELDGWT